jgi:hypothetical protein
MMTAELCRHGLGPCTCKLDEESKDTCRCIKCMTQLFALMVAEGLLIENKDGTFSLPEEHR